MNWRAGLAIVVGLLLPVPLLLAVGLFSPIGIDSSATSPRVQVIPRFSSAQLRAMPTFRRSCRGDADCDTALACLTRQYPWSPTCVASDCVTDSDCGEGSLCRPIQLRERVVRLCGGLGTVQEGEWCVKLPQHKDQGCAPGLVCVAGDCARRCQLQDPRSCPTGFACMDMDAEGPVCLHSCEESGCPEGQRCVQLSKGNSVCAQVHGKDCQHDEPCPAPRTCDVYMGAESRRGNAWMQCRLPCDKEVPSCPQDSACSASRCHRRCTKATEASVCEPFEHCSIKPGAEDGVCFFGER